MPTINHWWTTRPKRKLITVVDVLRVFLTVAEGRIWSRNRTLHLEFEGALEAQGLKGTGVRRDQGGGGGRTYAKWLSSFGLWFADSAGVVHSTFAGEDLLKGSDPVPVLTSQILNFQYPSPFSQDTRVSPRFRIFPFRFILQLLLDPRLDGYLTESEIAGFAATEAETDKDLSKVVQNISAYRKSGNNDSIFDGAFADDFGALSNLKDTANTFANQLEFTQLIIRRDGEGRIEIAAGQERRIVDLLKAAPPLITRIEPYESFQRKYGLGPHHQRDNRTFGSAAGVSASVSANQAERNKVLLTLWDILANQPITSIDAAVINRIAQKTGIGAGRIETIIASAGVQPSYDVFEQKYLQLSTGGRAFAKEFEQSTEGVFGSAGLGFFTDWIGAHPNNPDVLAVSDESGNEYSGILDSKAYKEYSISGDERRRMVHVYAPKYKVYRHHGTDVDLAFFLYVAGGFKSTINSGIEAVYRESNVRGSAVTARELLAVLRRHRTVPFSKLELKNLFTLNRRILPTDFT